MHTAAALAAAQGETDLFIYPGFEFRVVSGLLTNFHLPQSSLLMLVAAFAGREAVLAAYRAAVAARYRFYSYGDAMLVTRDRERGPGTGIRNRELGIERVGHSLGIGPESPSGPVPYPRSPFPVPCSLFQLVYHQKFRPE